QSLRRGRRAARGPQPGRRGRRPPRPPSPDRPGHRPDGGQPDHPDADGVLAAAPPRLLVAEPVADPSGPAGARRDPRAGSGRMTLSVRGPAMQYPDWIWHNGSIKPWAEATTHVMSH